MRKSLKKSILYIAIAILAILGIVFVSPDTAIILTNNTPDNFQIPQGQNITFEARVAHGSGISDLKLHLNTEATSYGLGGPRTDSEIMENVDGLIWQNQFDCTCYTNVEYYYEARYKKKEFWIFSSDEITRFPAEGTYNCAIENTTSEIPTTIWVNVNKVEDFLVRLNTRFTNILPCINVDDNLVEWMFAEGTEHWTFVDNISTGKTVSITTSSPEADVVNLKMKASYNEGQLEKCFYVFKHSVDSPGDVYYPELIDCRTF